MKIRSHSDLWKRISRKGQDILFKKVPEFIVKQLCSQHHFANADLWTGFQNYWPFRAHFYCDKIELQHSPLFNHDSLWL